MSSYRERSVEAMNDAKDNRGVPECVREACAFRPRDHSAVVWVVVVAVEGVVVVVVEGVVVYR